MRDIPPVPDHDIELSGGALALDFANTVGGTHVRPTHDHLRSYGDIASFAVLAGALSPSVAKRLAERAERDPRRAAAVYELGIALRESIWAVFSALASGESRRDADLDLIADAAADGAARSRLVYDKAGVSWSLPVDSDELDRPQRRVGEVGRGPQGRGQREQGGQRHGDGSHKNIPRDYRLAATRSGARPSRSAPRRG